VRRFAGFPVEIRWLSRFRARPPKQRKGRGRRRRGHRGRRDRRTHRLLAKDVRFRDLGLLIVDEEQRFGVAQKERLKALKSSVDVLAMSADADPAGRSIWAFSPARRFDHRDPARDRLRCRHTYLPFRGEVIREAISRSSRAAGQVFFVHNRVASIGAMAELVRRTVRRRAWPWHNGQMDERELEKAMDAFVEGRADVLVSTAIIENGLDIPNANTLIVTERTASACATLPAARAAWDASDRLAFAYLLGAARALA